jgi:uncharacterized repeat protein (TIGR01451 family)
VIGLTRITSRRAPHQPGALLCRVAALLLVSGKLMAAADLAVTMTADRLTVQPGVSGQDLVNFTVRLTNGGVDPAAAIVTDLLPAGLSIPAGMSAVPSDGTYDAVTGRWEAGTLDTGAVAILLLPAQALAGAAGCLVNAVTATLAPGSGTTDSDPDNDSARVAVGAPACADLAVSSFRDDDFSGACLDADHIIRVSNNGPTPATSVRLAITRYEVTSPGGFSERSCTTGNVVVPGTATIDLGTLASGETKEFVTGLDNLQRDGVDITVAFDVNVAAAEPDPDAANSRESGSYTIRRSFGFSDNDGSTCIIVSALGGSRFADRIPLLRQFRDRYLLAHPAGRAFVAWYYEISPPAAAALSHDDHLRAMTRMMLVPLIYALQYPLATGGLLLTVLLARRRRVPAVMGAR